MGRVEAIVGTILGIVALGLFLNSKQTVSIVGSVATGSVSLVKALQYR